EPERADEAAGIEVVRRQVRGELRFKLARHGELALIHERGIGAPAHRLDETQAPIGDGQPHGTGVAVRYALLHDKRKLALGLDLEVLRWSLPYVEHRTCVENCDDVPALTIERGTAAEPTLGIGLTPSYRHRRWIVFGGLFVRNHPTVVRKGSEIGLNHEDLESGPLNYLLHAGVSYRVVDGISLLVLAHQNLTMDPVRYGPSLGLALSASPSSR
nr:hypothetical protein [Myxococcota bacterium]